MIVIDDLSTGNPANLDPRAELVEGSILDTDLLKRHFAGADYVFHLAALPRIQPSFDSPVEHERINVEGTISCLLAARENRQLKKFVLSSSSACYGTPSELPTTELAAISCTNPYALQKYTSEQYGLILGRHFGIPLVSLRYFNAYGQRSFNPKNPFNAYSSVIGVFHRQKKEGKPLTVTGDGKQARDFVHVWDIAQANLLAALSDKEFEVFNVGSGTSVSINELAGLFGGPITYIPERKGEALITWADISKISAELGWEPRITLSEGMRNL